MRPRHMQRDIRCRRIEWDALRKGHRQPSTQKRACTHTLDQMHRMCCANRNHARSTPQLACSTTYHRHTSGATNRCRNPSFMKFSPYKKSFRRGRSKNTTLLICLEGTVPVVPTKHATIWGFWPHTNMHDQSGLVCRRYPSVPRSREMTRKDQQEKSRGERPTCVSHTPFHAPKVSNIFGICSDDEFFFISFPPSCFEWKYLFSNTSLSFSNCTASLSTKTS
jgi:hypothetical protein